MRPLLLLDIVGLTQSQIGPDTPNLAAFAKRGASAPMSAILPAVTCSAQATMLTGTLPSEHGAVGNGWMAPATREVALWRQANTLVSGEKLYEVARREDPDFRCAKLFWWWNMGAQVDYSITPRPFYPADGRKLLAVYAAPHEYGAEMEKRFGAFPFFDFWGPKSGLPSTRWIADVTIATLKEKRPHLTMAYLPHLDYDHQRFGPNDPRSKVALREMDAVFGDLLAAADEVGGETVVVSEYGIRDVSRPIDINRVLREAGLLKVRETPVGDVLDVFASRAFALADHQLAHVYTQDVEAAREALQGVPGIESILEGPARAEAGLDHDRAGELVCISEPDAWFTYYYWNTRENEPDFARTIDIHRKPGYDPCELFLDPNLGAPMLRIASFLAKKKLGFRALMKVVPVDANLVLGSHGRLPDTPEEGPVFLSSLPFGQAGPEPTGGTVQMTSVKERVLGMLRELR